MGFAPAWPPSVAARYWPIAAPKAASACRPERTNAPGHIVAQASHRLKRRAEFLRVAAAGRKAAQPGVVLQARPRDDTAPARLGFTVTKKVGNAVVRNRTRRRLKEAAAVLLRAHPLTGFDLVLIGRDATRARPFATLIEDVRRALVRVGAAGGA